MRTCIDVDELVVLFESCKIAGLDLKLQSVAPLNSDAFAFPEDLSPGEVGHLCMMLVDAHDLAESDARRRLDAVKDQCRGLSKKNEVREMLRTDYGREPFDCFLSMNPFCVLLRLISTLMHIDIECIEKAMLWCEHSSFELTDSLVAKFLEHCTRKRLHHTHTVERPLSAHAEPDEFWKSLTGALSASGDETSVPIADKKFQFTLNDLSRVAYNCSLDLHLEDLTSIYTHTLHRLHIEECARRAKRRSDPLPSVERGRTEHVRPKEDSGGAAGLRALVGRWEFERLMEEIWKRDYMRKAYRSPLAMTAALIVKAIESPELTAGAVDLAKTTPW
jgi:hypothetical protein